MNGEASLYVHVPFCKRKCPYCHFFVLPDKPDQHQILVDTLLKEWELYNQLLSNFNIVSVYFGGGTPALLGPRHIATLIDTISPSSQAEITLEANPEGVEREKVREFSRAGVNRMSLGIQSFDNDLLKTLGRQHTAEQAIQAVEDVVYGGISNVTIDLMYELPGQTLERWLKTVAIASELPIAHLSLYNLTIEPHTVYHKKRAELIPLIPSQEEGTEMYTQAIKAFSHAGLAQYELSAFARGGHYSRHNTGYWIGRPYIGLGPSAHSFWGNKRWKNVEHLGKYLAAVEKGAAPQIPDEDLSEDARQRELLAIRLRLLEGVDLAAWKLPPETLKVLQKLQHSGLLENKGTHWCLSAKGLYHYDTIAVELI